MPMDIRKFFAKKDGGKKEKKKRETVVKPRATAAAKNDSDPARAEEDVAAVARKPRIAKKAKKQIIIDSSEEERDNETTPSPKKRKAASERVQVSASSFFGSDGSDPSNATNTKKRRSSPRKAAAETKDSSVDLTNEEQRVKSAAKPIPKTKRPAENGKPKAEASSSKKTRTTTASRKKPPKELALKPTLSLDSFDVDNERYAGCLEGKTFCLTGILPDLSRDEAADFLKILGARVTTAVSSKTDYLVVGDILEDGRAYTEGSKYRKAMEVGTVQIVRGEKQLYGLAQQYQNMREPKSAPAITTATTAKEDSTTLKKAPVAVAGAAAAPKTVPVNPYARKTAASNPYARTATSVNPYAKKASVTNNKVDSKPAAKPSGAATEVPQTNMLWVDKYKPRHSSEILGNQDAVRKLQGWLRTWEDKFNTPRAVGKTFSAPGGPWKAALLSGPPGIGKTTTATLVAKESGRDVLEFNASDVRSKKTLQQGIGDITGSCTLEFRKADPKTRTKRCIIFDEVDGMGAGDRGGVAELISLIKNSRVPIICICNDRQNQKMKSLLPYCMDLRYRRPVKSTIARRALEVAQKEGLRVEQNAAEAIAESCGNDVRQVLNCLQMWASNSDTKSRISYKDLKDREKSINKDEILRVSLFDAARCILEGRRGLSGADAEAERSHFLRRNDAFFVDYSFIGLLVQQNYLKVVSGQFNEAKRSAESAKNMQGVLEQMHQAADALSEYALAEDGLRGGQNWSLLPFTAALTVKTGYHAGGEKGGVVPGYPEFTAWLGKNSSKGKKMRILQELQHHLNYKVSGGTQEMRMSYLPVFREQFMALLSDDGAESVEKTIQLMDDYGLDRDDVFERLDEFKMNPKARGFGDLNSKQKAAFTRTYNQMAHKSQALVAEQGGGKKKTRRAGAAPVGEAADLDAIDDDKVAEEEEDDDVEEEDVEKIKAMFKPKGRKKAVPKKGAARKPRAKKKK